MHPVAILWPRGGMHCDLAATRMWADARGRASGCRE